jgi:hypothetical protein
LKTATTAIIYIHAMEMEFISTQIVRFL